MAWQPGYVKRPWSTTLHGNWYSLEKKITESQKKLAKNVKPA